MFSGTCGACFLAAALLAAPIAGVRQIAVSRADEAISVVSPSFESAQSSDVTTFTLEGSVVNSVTGEPIRNALVQTYFTHQISTLTGVDGKFKFEGLPYGQSVIVVRKPGFFSEDDLGYNAGRRHAVWTGPNNAPTVLKLVPEGVIYGRVSGDDGEGIEGLAVQLMARRLRDGRKVTEPQGSLTTDEDGAFRIAELPPGTYFLHVGPSRNPVSFAANSSKASTMGYPAIFYASAREIADAAPIQITPGKRVEINVTMPVEPFHRVSGTVAGYAAGQSVFFQFLDSSGSQMAVSPRFDAARGTFEVRWMPAGSYTLVASSRDGQGRTLTATVPMNVSTEVAGLHLVLSPTMTIPVRVSIASSRADSEGFSGQEAGQLASVVLERRDSGSLKMQIASQPVSEGGKTFMEMRDVPPGKYSLEIHPNGPLYVHSATSGSVNLLESDLIVPAGGVPPIEIVLRDDVASIRGRISLDGQPARGVVIAIGKRAAEDPRVQSANEDGVFEFDQLAPGEYTVLAVDRPDELEYANPEVLKKYRVSAKEITLSGLQTAKIDLELVQMGEGQVVQ